MVYSIINTRKRNFNLAFIFTIISGFSIYFPEYFEKSNIYKAIICDILNLFQILTISANYFETYLPKTDDVILFNIGLLLRAVIHVSLPALLGVVTFRFIRKNLELWKAKFVSRRKKSVYILSCYNEQAIRIAESIADNMDKSVAIIFYGAEKINPDLEEKLGYKQISHISHKMKLDVQSGRLPQVDVSKSELYYFLVDNPDDNIDIGLRLQDYYEKTEKNNLKNIHIAAFSDNSSSDETIIDSIKTIIDFRIINNNRLFAYKLMTEQPLYNSIKSGELSILIIGFDKLAEEFMMAAIACGQLPEVKLKINVIAEKTELICEYLNVNFPEILNSDYDIKFFESNPDRMDFNEIIKKNCSDAGYVVICGTGDQDENVKTAVKLRRFLLSVDGSYTNYPFIAAYVSNDKKADLLMQSKYRIHPFGYNEQIYTYDELVNPELESLSKRINFAYSGLPQEDDEAAYRSAMNSYYALEYNRKSSLSAAVSIKYKLWCMGLDMEKCEDSEADTSLIDIMMKKSDISSIAEAEHRRWMAYSRTEGMTLMTVDEAENIVNSNISLLDGKIAKSLYLNKHMDLVPLKEIKGISEEINRRCKSKIDSKVLPKKNTEKVDDDIIRALPEILGNPIWKKYTGGYLYKVSVRDK